MGRPQAERAVFPDEQQRAQATAVTKLLDHVAVELACEYVRLMEAAAEHDRQQAGTTRVDDEGRELR